MRAVVADLSDPDPKVLESALKGADGVLSGLGASRPADAGITTRGTRAIVRAMEAAGAHRLVVVSAAPVSTVPSRGNPTPPKRDPGEGPLLGYVLTPMIKTVLRGVYADLAEMEDVLRDSDLDWTVVRPPRLTSKPLSGGRYRTAYGQNLRGGMTASRADVAHLMLAVLDRPESVRQAVGIAR